MICGSCGRALKGAESIERGYGPICYRKIMPPAPRAAKTRKSNEKSNYNLADDCDYEVPGQMELSEFIDMSEGGQNDD